MTAPVVLVTISSSWLYPRPVIYCAISIPILIMQADRASASTFSACGHTIGRKQPNGRNSRIFSTKYALDCGHASQVEKSYRSSLLLLPGSLEK